MRGRAGWIAALLGAWGLAACGVRAPPRPPLLEDAPPPGVACAADGGCPR